MLYVSEESYSNILYHNEDLKSLSRYRFDKVSERPKLKQSVSRLAGCSPTTYQSGQLYSSHATIEKRESKYLRWALINAARYVCLWEPTFTAYLAKKRSEGKHYYVALSHATKKLVRLLYNLEITGAKY